MHDAAAREPPGPARQRVRARRRDHAWIAAGLALLAALLSLSGLLWRPERLLYDSALALWSQPTPPDITIIAIDEPSIAAIGRWPWSRAVHATLLTQLREARPRALALDLVLSEPDPDPRQDALLAEAMARLGVVVLPSPWVPGSGDTPRWLDPAPPLAQAAARLAAAEPTVDDDGVLRHVFLELGAAQARRPHVALAMLDVAGEQRHPALRPEAITTGPAAGGWLRNQRLLLRYAGPPGHVQRVSYVDVLAGRVPLHTLQGRHLLVGMTAAGLGDTLATPVNAAQHAMPGVEVLAQTLHMLRSGHGVQAAPAWLQAATSALLAAAGLLALVRLNLRAALLAALAAVLLLPLAGVLGLGLGWWLSPLPAMVAAALAYPLLSWRRLELATAGLDLEIRRLQLPSQHALPLPADADPIQGRLDRLQSAGELLRAARRFLADVLASLPTGMLVADASGRVLMANAQAAAVFEIDGADELEGLDLARLLAEFEGVDATAPRPDWPALLLSLVPGGDSPSLPVRMPGRGDQAGDQAGDQVGDYVLQLSAAELAGQRRVLVALSDVAAIRRAERQREEALAFVSHDLRSPASTIALLTAAQGPPDGLQPAVPWQQQVHTLARRMLTLSEAFVRQAQTERLQPQIEPVPLATLLGDVLAELGPQATAAGIALQTSVEPPDAHFVLDRSGVGRALINLAVNALRHSPARGTVRLQLAVAGDGALRVFVGDDGPGLDAAQQQQLASGEHGLASRAPGGIGLGLRFVQRVARQHGGRLAWQPRTAGAPGGFVLQVPAARAQDATAESGIP